jgi:hypothetical protein
LGDALKPTNPCTRLIDAQANITRTLKIAGPMNS